MAVTIAVAVAIGVVVSMAVIVTTLGVTVAIAAAVGAAAAVAVVGAVVAAAASTVVVAVTDAVANLQSFEPAAGEPVVLATFTCCRATSASRVVIRSWDVAPARAHADRVYDGFRNLR